MDKKIIFLDLDGTLVSPRQGPTKKIIEAVQQVQRNGHLVFICTGRNLCGIDPELIDLKFDGIISSAGGHIQIKDDVLHQSFIEYQKLIEIIDVFEKNNIVFYLEGTYRTYASEELVEMFALGKVVKSMNSEMQRLCQEVKKSFNIKPMEDFYRNPEGIHKISFIARKMEDLIEPKEKLAKDFNFVVHDIFSRETINGEIIDKNTNKATAIHQVIDALQLPIEDTIGFGDSMNDYEMLEVVEHGVAMENATQELKNIASIVCPSVEEDGVYHELKRLQLI